MKKTFKKYFIPHPGNNHKPHFLRAKAVSLTALVVATLFLLSASGTYMVSHNPNLAAVKAAFLVDLTNKDREAEGLHKLSINQNLVVAAGMKANDMSSKSYFAHVSPDGKSPWHWIKEAGYKYVYAGENLAVNFSSSEDVEEAWMDSPTHKKNILNSKFTEIGIATSPGVYKGDNTVYVVQMFGSPMPANVTEVRNQNIQSAVTPSTNDGSRPISSNNLTENANNVLGEEIAIATPSDVSDILPASATPVSPEAFMEFSNPEIPPQDIAIYESVVGVSDNVPVYTNWFQRLIVSPSEVVQDIYAAIMALVIFSLIMKIFIEIRQQHPKNIAFGVALLAVIVFFMHLNSEMAVPPVLALI